jgi:hypothetical protein
VKVEIDNPFEEKSLTLIDQGQMTLQHMEESANREKLVLSMNRNRPIVQKLVLIWIRTKLNSLHVLRLQKAMNDYEELAKLKK